MAEPTEERQQHSYIAWDDRVERYRGERLPELPDGIALATVYVLRTSTSTTIFYETMRAGLGGVRSRWSATVGTAGDLLFSIDLRRNGVEEMVLRLAPDCWSEIESGQVRYAGTDEDWGIAES